MPPKKTMARIFYKQESFFSFHMCPYFAWDPSSSTKRNQSGKKESPEQRAQISQKNSLIFDAPFVRSRLKVIQKNLPCGSRKNARKSRKWHTQYPNQTDSVELLLQWLETMQRQLFHEHFFQRLEIDIRRLFPPINVRQFVVLSGIPVTQNFCEGGGEQKNFQFPHAKTVSGWLKNGFKSNFGDVCNPEEITHYQKHSFLCFLQRHLHGNLWATEYLWI